MKPTNRNPWPGRGLSRKSKRPAPGSRTRRRYVVRTAGPASCARALVQQVELLSSQHSAASNSPSQRSVQLYPCVTIYFSNQPIWADCRIFNFCLFQFRPGLHRTADPYLAGKLSLSAFQRGMGRVCAARHPSPSPGNQFHASSRARARSCLMTVDRQQTRRWRSPGSAPACPPQPRRHRRRPPPVVLSPSPPLIPRTP
eukprot:SAG22_NODE_828_length_6952_cov_8.477240_4_plen_199_part_00